MLVSCSGLRRVPVLLFCFCYLWMALEHEAYVDSILYTSCLRGVGVGRGRYFSALCLGVDIKSTKTRMLLIAVFLDETQG
jgi:hypothetical protein